MENGDTVSISLASPLDEFRRQAQPTDRQAKTLDSHTLLVAALMVAKSRSRQARSIRRSGCVFYKRLGGVIGNQLIGPYFYRENLTGERHVKILFKLGDQQRYETKTRKKKWLEQLDMSCRLWGCGSARASGDASVGDADAVSLCDRYSRLRDVRAMRVTSRSCCWGRPHHQQPRTWPASREITVRSRHHIKLLAAPIYVLH
uniref:Uncharacterized protein n=1 Tax=Rhodnius prolixus TaxID=13249 RepID=T1HR42_RHOPR